MLLELLEADMLQYKILIRESRHMTIYMSHWVLQLIQWSFLLRHQMDKVQETLQWVGLVVFIPLDQEHKMEVVVYGSLHMLIQGVIIHMTNYNS